MEIIPLKLRTKRNKFDLFGQISTGKHQIKAGDIIVISSKYVSMSQGKVIELDKVKTSSLAKKIAHKYHIDIRLTEVIIREADHIFGGIPGFLLAIKDGVLAPNAGIDKSNVPKGHVILYPNDTFKVADQLRMKFLLESGLRVGVVIADSRLMPTRIGTVGLAIAVSGFEPVEDMRGTRDLFGNILRVTFKATADSIATMGVSSMGEGKESTPVAIIRNLKVKFTDRKISWQDMAVDAYQDVYIRGFRDSF